MRMGSLASIVEAALELDRLNRQCGGPGKEGFLIEEEPCPSAEVEEAILRVGNGHASEILSEFHERYRGPSVSANEAFLFVYRRVVAYERPEGF